MKIVLTGGTGFIGSAVLDRLVGDGHTVTAVVRSESSAEKVKDAGAEPLSGDLSDREWLTGVLRGADGAIHAAAGSDEHDPEINDAVIESAITAFGGTDKPFVLTGGVWTYGSGTDLTEASPADPPAITSWRVGGEQRLLDSGVRASVIQPGIVYGHGQGIPALVAGGPRTPEGALTLIGSGDQHWTTVDVDDLADLYLIVLTQAPGGSAYIAASGQNPTVRELGEAVADDVVPGSADEAAERLGGPMSEALLLDQQARGEHARELGWSPSGRSLVEQLAAGYTAD